jgi:hypothetical protein
MAGAPPLGSAEAAATAAAVFKKSRRLTSWSFSIVKTPISKKLKVSEIFYTHTGQNAPAIYWIRRTTGRS